MWRWLARNADALGAVSAVAMAIAATLALTVVPYQINQAELIQRDQTAREIYREFLNLTVQKPDLATADFCTLQDPRERAAYSAYADYLLYTAEQMVETSPDWQRPMAGYLEDHKAYFCSRDQALDIGALGAELGLVCTETDRCP